MKTPAFLLTTTLMLILGLGFAADAWAKTCPQCAAEAPDASQFCPDCGKKFSALKACGSCGQKAASDARFCPGCGEKFAFSSEDEDRVVTGMTKARAEYQKQLEKLGEFYRSVGLADKQQEAELELAAARESVRVARMESARNALSPAPIQFKSVEEADKLYEQAEELRRSPNIFKRREYLARAIELYQKILLRHADSDKADDSAYRLGEIYETPFFENYEKSVDYYRKAFLWNPKTDFEARFKAAEVAEYRLRNKELAIALYQECAQNDPVQENRRLSKERLQRLKEK